MEINDLMAEVLGQSLCEGRFTYEELLHYSAAHSLSGIGVSRGEASDFFLIISRGEPDGAILVDGMGTLFGDLAALHLTGDETFELYPVAQTVVDALTSRCRVFEKSHLKKNGRLDIPIVGTPEGQRVGVLCLTVCDGVKPLAGGRVTIRKGRVMLASDVTDNAGRVCFRLLNGRYMCIVSDRIEERTRCVVEFHEPRVEVSIDIRGAPSESVGW
jgi:hypothetical protein